MRKKQYLNLTATVQSKELCNMNGDGKTIFLVHFEQDGAPAETAILIDAQTYVSRTFSKGERVRIITQTELMDDDSPCPAIIAHVEFQDMFDGEIEKLFAFRRCSRELQEMIFVRHCGQHYKYSPENKVSFTSKKAAEDYYHLTKNTFTPNQQRSLEGWLKNFGRNDNARRADTLMQISPVCGMSEPVDIAALRQALDARFSGMAAQKEAILRHFSASQFSGRGGSAICLVGPAGTGKTALVRALGEVLHKPYVPIACSGISSAADILGDRAVYSSSDVGMLTNAFRKAGTSDCLVHLDEFDKMPSTTIRNRDGNPYHAFLQIFSERAVTDTYLGVEISCENTLFICTCNSLENVPATIRNRFAVIINIPAYTDADLLEILQQHTIPRLNETYHIPEHGITFTKGALPQVLKYIDDFGARRTESHMESIYQQLIAQWEEQHHVTPVRVTAAMVDSMLKKVTDMKDPMVQFRRHMQDYTPEIVERVIALKENLDRPDLDEARRQHDSQQLSYFVNLRAEHSPFTFAAERFFEAADAALYGLQEEKKLLASLFHELAVRKNNANKRILLVGPPGVGKSALIQAAAAATGMPYIRIGMNGVETADYLKGFGASYRNADAGIVVRETAKAGSTRVLIHIDEIDKVARPEVQEALLSLLDDSGLFADDFLDGIPVDFRSAVFIATANEYRMAPPLLSRFSVVELGSYSRAEQREILHRYLIPAACDGYDKPVRFMAEAEEALIGYLNGGGVRGLKEHVMRVVREMVFAQRGTEEVIITAGDVARILGPTPLIRGNRPAVRRLAGISNGLAVTGGGDGMCFAIESRVLTGQGVEITGLPSEVIRDSVKLAMGVLSADFGIDFEDKKVHIHFAEGAVKKDGPSAGTSIFMSLYSAATGKPIPANACYTGEIDLFGYVWAVGGIVEKVSAADRLGIETAYIPQQSYDKLSDHERQQLATLDIKVVPVTHIREIVDKVYCHHAAKSA